MMDIREEQARRALTDYLAALRLVMPMPEGFVYRGAADFVLRHGVWYEPCRWVHGLGGAQKQCYGNSVVFAATRGWKYVEGWCVAPIGDGGMFPVEHAWNVDTAGRLADCTWLNTGLAYFGVEFSVERADEAIWDWDACVLDDHKRGHPLFRQPWEGETAENACAESDRVRLLRAGRIGEVKRWMMAQFSKEAIQ